MNTSFNEPKPGLVTAIALMTLTSGIVNLFWGFVASATALGTIIGVICLPITILPTILGVFEIIYAAKLLSAQPQPTQPSTAIAIFEILTVLMFNVYSVIVGILVLIFYNDVTVKDYFTRINSTQNTGTTPAATTPSLPEEPQPAALTEPKEKNPEENAEEVEEEKPVEKPKRTRKTSK